MDEINISYSVTEGGVTYHQLSLFPLPKFYRTSFDEDARVWKEKTKVKLYVDGLMTSITKRKQIDVVKLDRILKSKYHYQKIGNCFKCTMKDFVVSEFGEDIAFILDKWTLIPKNVLIDEE